MRVLELWRFPVKSIGGERLATAHVTEIGIAGDRGWGITDLSTGKVLTGRRAPELLMASARIDDTDVVITLPDGTETADPAPYAERSTELGGTGLTVRDDRSICEHAGFCGNQVTNVWEMVGQTDDTIVRSQVIAMVERCPSGALTYSAEPEGEVEPDFATQVAVVADGPLWVTGGVPIERSDGQAVERRNRVTLCRCGQSANKPYCDGSHKESGFSDS